MAPCASLTALPGDRRGSARKWNARPAGVPARVPGARGGSGTGTGPRATGGDWLVGRSAALPASDAPSFRSALNLLSAEPLGSAWPSTAPGVGAAPCEARPTRRALTVQVGGARCRPTRVGNCPASPRAPRSSTAPSSAPARGPPRVPPETIRVGPRAEPEPASAGILTGPVCRGLCVCSSGIVRREIRYGRLGLAPSGRCRRLDPARTFRTRCLLQLRCSLEDVDGERGHEHHRGGLDGKSEGSDGGEPIESPPIPGGRARGVEHAVKTKPGGACGLSTAWSSETVALRRSSSRRQSAHPARWASTCARASVARASSSRSESHSRASWQLMSGSAPACP